MPFFHKMGCSDSPCLRDQYGEYMPGDTRPRRFPEDPSRPDALEIPGGSRVEGIRWESAGDGVLGRAAEGFRRESAEDGVLCRAAEGFRSEGAGTDRAAENHVVFFLTGIWADRIIQGLKFYRGWNTPCAGVAQSVEQLICNQ